MQHQVLGILEKYDLPCDMVETWERIFYLGEDVWLDHTVWRPFVRSPVTGADSRSPWIPAPGEILAMSLLWDSPYGW